LIGFVTTKRDRLVNVTLQQQLSGISLDEQNFDFEYDEADGRNFGNSVWGKLVLQEGGELLVSRCRMTNAAPMIKFAVSRNDLFQQVRNVISFDSRLQNNPKSILIVPKILIKEASPLFAGYAITLLWSGLAANNNDAATVLSEIMSLENVPPIGRSLVRLGLRRLLLKRGEGELSEETRRGVQQRLIVLAGSAAGPDNEVFTLLAELTDRQELDIRHFITARNRNAILRNYETFRKSDGRSVQSSELERQLKRL
jgi:hypothetical protein